MITNIPTPLCQLGLRALCTALSTRAYAIDSHAGSDEVWASVAVQVVEV